MIDLRLGDCRDGLPSLPDNSAKSMITDLPYGVGITYGIFDDTPEYVRDLLKVIIPHGVRICTGAILMPAGKFDNEIWLYQNFPPKWRLCWYKGALSSKSAVGFNDWESILVYGKKVCVNAHDFFRAKTEPMGTDGHPCPKSVEWAEWLVSRFTKEGDTVIDPCMGRGTVGIACVKLNRSFVGFEINPTYFEIAQRRITEAQQQLTLALA